MLAFQLPRLSKRGNHPTLDALFIIYIFWAMELPTFISTL
jgi:hypothetical protein